MTTYATPTSGEEKPATGGDETATAAPAAKPAKRQRPTWATALDPYSKPRVARSILEIATSVVPFLALWVAMYLALDVSYLLVLALAVPTAGFLLRSFIIFHDCTHGSFLPSRRGNRWLGIVTGLFVFQPFENWRHDHWVHHGSAGDLDRRGQGDVPTLTVAEYQSRSWRGRLGYWLFRHPLVMFGLGPIYSLVIMPRFYASTATQAQRRSVIGTNIALVIIIGTIFWLIGWQAFLLIEVPMVMLAGTAGVWLFYVQHQFEDVYWEGSNEWSYADAALRGSSYLKLPKVLQFFSGNIGLHHVHHLSARIPNYNLQRAHDDNEIFHDVPQLSMWDGLRAVRLKLWDEDSRRLVTFAEARATARSRRSRSVGAPATER